MKLSVKGVRFNYSSAPILNGVCLDVSGPEIVGVVGPNGAGKSTLVKCIDRMLTPCGGSIFLDSEDVFKMNRRALAKKLGYIPQRVTQSFPSTVFDVVLAGRRPHMGWTVGEKDLDKVVEVMKKLNIDDLALKDFNELSGGQQQKVYIARTLAQETGLLLLDEPTSNLDIRHQLEVMNIIRDIVIEKDISAIVVLHDLNLAIRYSDRILLMKDGAIYAAGEPGSVLTEENIRIVYGVEAIVRRDMAKPFIVPISPL